MSTTIVLGATSDLTALFSYPNIPGSNESLVTTILHWWQQTMDRDGVTALGGTADVKVDGDKYLLVLSGPPACDSDFKVYATRLPQFLANGWGAYSNDIPKVKAAGLWPADNHWRFFLPLGLPLSRQRSVQLFHYPPGGLLNPLRDYLNDPVPIRWSELLVANGLPDFATAYLLETVIDSAPVAARDDEGSSISKMLANPDYFLDYQRSQLSLLMNTAATNAGYTIPLAVLGAPARTVFQTIFGKVLGVNKTTTVEIVPGKVTPVIGVNHPYYFYLTAQGTVGSGKILPAKCAAAKELMTLDLIAARWQKLMADDPSQNPDTVLADCTTFWRSPSVAAGICQLMLHQGSLFYENPADPTHFKFNVSLEDATKLCDAQKQNPCAAGC